MIHRRNIFRLAVLTLIAAAIMAASRGAQPGPDIPYTKIESELVVAASLAEAWKCWSTGEGAKTFFAPHADIGAYPGGPFEIWFNPRGAPGERGAENLKVLSVLPGEMISFEWNAPPQFTHARPLRTWVVVTLQPVDARHTRVRMVHLGWDEMKAKHPDHAAEWDDVKAYFENAWPKVLGWMKRRFEDGPRWDANGKDRWISS